MLKETAFHAVPQDSGIPIPLPASDAMLALLLIQSTSGVLAPPLLLTSMQTKDVLPVTVLQDGILTLLPV
jgi:hypothetical protein